MDYIALVPTLILGILIWLIIRRKKTFVIATIAVLGILTFIAGLVVLLTSGDCKEGCDKNYAVPSENTKSSRVAKGAIVTNGHECAQIGHSIIQKNGSVVDAAIAALFCEGIAMPQSTGLGGGFFMTIFINSTKEAIHLDAREVAPSSAYEDMYQGNASISARGGLSVAVPGELKGYWVAWKRFGKLPWAELVQPTIDLCRRGNLVTTYLAKLLKSQEQKLLNSSTLKEIFINPATNQVWQEGDFIKRDDLAKTLEVIAAEGGDALYNGSLTTPFVEDLKSMGSIITEEDMRNYQPRWESPTVSKLANNFTLYSSPLPGSGVLMTFIMNILLNFLNLNDAESLTNYQRIVESFKYGYGKRTELGDPYFIPGIQGLLFNLTSADYAEYIRNQIFDNITFSDPEHYGANTTQPADHGTAHISILAPNGDAVSVTGTINLYFGAYIRSTSTGIILNDEMDDFSAPNITNSFNLPPSPANYIRPGKRPMSSMAPCIITDNNGIPRLVIGAAGGSKITTSIAQVIIRHLWFGLPLVEAINAKRFHHQLFPMEIEFESGFNKTEILDGLTIIGHNYTISPAETGFSAVTAVSKSGNFVEAAWDPRRSGSIYLFD